MARNFFTGGMMPSDDLLEYFDSNLRVARKWRHDGQEYARTIEAWLDRLDAAREDLLPVLERHAGGSDAVRQLGKWRLFLMASAEFFGFREGNEWGVSHYLMEPVRDPGTSGGPSR
jgi:cyclopropane-fatty-acyl-phospholipid synthase